MVVVFVTLLLSLLGGTFAKKYVQYDELSQANFPPCGLLCYAADIVHCGLTRYDYYSHCTVPEFSMSLRECSLYQCNKTDHNQVLDSLETSLISDGYRTRCVLQKAGSQSPETFAECTKHGLWWRNRHTAFPRLRQRYCARVGRPSDRCAVLAHIYVFHGNLELCNNVDRISKEEGC